MKKSWPREIYEKASISDLILVSFYFLNGANKKIGFEDLLKKSFDLFPQKFCLAKYCQWPDSQKLDRPLRALRRKKMILGGPKENFTLTKTGRKRALETINLFRQRKLKLK